MDEGQRRTYSYSERGVSRDAARHVPTNDGTMLQKAPGSASTPPLGAGFSQRLNPGDETMTWAWTL